MDMQLKQENEWDNPRSVVTALSNNNIGNYWTSSGPYDEIYYIKNNEADVKADLVLMVSGEAVQAESQELRSSINEFINKE